MLDRSELFIAERICLVNEGEFSASELTLDVQTPLRHHWKFEMKMKTLKSKSRHASPSFHHTKFLPMLDDSSRCIDPFGSEDRDKFHWDFDSSTARCLCHTSTCIAGLSRIVRRAECPRLSDPSCSQSDLDRTGKLLVRFSQKCRDIACYKMTTWSSHFQALVTWCTSSDRNCSPKCHAAFRGCAQFRELRRRRSRNVSPRWSCMTRLACTCLTQERDRRLGCWLFHSSRQHKGRARSGWLRDRSVARLCPKRDSTSAATDRSCWDKCRCRCFFLSRSSHCEEFRFAWEWSWLCSRATGGGTIVERR